MANVEKFSTTTENDNAVRPRLKVVDFNYLFGEKRRRSPSSSDYESSKKFKTCSPKYNEEPTLSPSRKPTRASYGPMSSATYSSTVSPTYSPALLPIYSPTVSSCPASSPYSNNAPSPSDVNTESSFYEPILMSSDSESEDSDSCDETNSRTRTYSVSFTPYSPTHTPCSQVLSPYSAESLPRIPASPVYIPASLSHGPPSPSYSYNASSLSVMNTGSSFYEPILVSSDSESEDSDSCLVTPPFCLYCECRRFWYTFQRLLLNAC